jgi:hypothetical protein
VSIDIKGSYLVALYSKDPGDENILYCQTFQSASGQVIPNLGAQPILKDGVRYLDSVYVISTK